ncbi:MAG: AAA family ATPase, partial [Deltaproteobacteria bacterium]|nr:AAA family ATPase [Deltaproteobacteria bacterium]
MKILQLRFKNLNSLCGEWFVDFTSPEYASDGIFAITGPTGSGKTTILDAICLALYGRTPRLTRVTKSGNEIMARQTGECFAEVTFETQSGRFRCHWDFQPPKHEIADAKNGQIIETKIRDVAAAIESRTGMDFDRFTRSMLLAQGGFAAFLQAAPDERAPILEQITGTELYSEISRRVHERHREEHGKLDLLKAELSGIQLLSAEEKQQLTDDLKEKQNTETELSQKNEQLNKAVTWLDEMANLEKELDAIEGELEAFQIKQKNFEPEQKKLQRANQAVLVDGEFAALSFLRNQQKNDIQALFDAQNRQPEYEKALTESDSARKNTERDLQTARENLKKEQEIIKKVRALDFQIEEKTKAKKSSAKEIQALHKQIEKIGKIKTETEKKHHSARSDLSSIDQYLSKHDVDAALVSDLTGIQQRLDNLRTAFDKKHQLNQALKTAKKQHDGQALACLKSEQAATELQSRIKNSKDQTRQLSDAIEKRLDGRNIQQWRNELDGLKERSRVLEKVSDLLNTISTTQTKLLELQTTHTSLKQEKVKSGREITAASEKQKTREREVGYLEKQVVLMNRIRNLEAERAHLEDGKPCPLCGSENHPYAEGNIPAMDETESALKAAKKTLKALSKQLSALQVKQAKLDKDIEQADFRIKEQYLQLKE